MFPRIAASFFLAATLFVGSVAWCGPLARAQDAVLTTLHSFAIDEGASPQGGLTQGSDGNFYGTTDEGGPSGVGTIFEVTPDGNLTVSHSFTTAEGTNPESSLMQTADGSFYGTTVGNGPNGGGTVFKVTPDGTVTTLHGFDSNGSSHPSGLTPGLDGNFYGTLSNAVFSVTPAGTVTILYTLGSNDGEYPLGLTRGMDGNFYGTTGDGGVDAAGTIFQVTPGGAFKVLHNFSYDNAYPTALTAGSDGNLYGMTGGGNGDDAVGTIYRITPAGVFTILHTFSNVADNHGDNSDGAAPRAAIFQASDGNLYGVTSRGGANNSGTIFRCTLSGSLTALHSFGVEDDSHFPAGSPDGALPLSPLTQGSDGNLYGTTAFGGDTDDGTVFVLDLHGLTAFAVPSDTVSEAGGSVTQAIVRTSSAGAASVSYATQDSTALAGTDYTAASGTLAWADGDVSSRTITVPLLDRGVRDGSTRTFSVVLGDPVNTSLGAPASVNITISEDDLSPPVLTYVSDRSAVVGLSFNDPISATNSPTSFSADGLPPGLTVDADGAITGEPSVAGTFTVTLHATNAAGTGSAVITLTVTSPPVTLTVADDGTAQYGGKAARLIFHRPALGGEGLTVYYKIKGSAKAGVDYKPLSGYVVFSPTASQVTLKLKPLDNPQNPGELQAKVILLSPGDDSYAPAATPPPKITFLAPK